MRRLARMGAPVHEATLCGGNATKHYLFMILAVVLLFGCTDDNLVSPDLAQGIDPASVRLIAATQPVGPQAVEGEIGLGSEYGLYLPETWNGDLVLYAHGGCYEEFGCPEGELPVTDSDFKGALLAQGYAVAWTSYSEVGFAVKDGAIRVRQLKGLFTSRFGKPEHTYLYGMSMGGAVAMHLAESNPELFDGVLTDSGENAGVLFEVDYFFNCLVLFDYFFLGILPGWSSWDKFSGELLTRTHNRPFFDNSEVHYTGSTNDAALNAGVERYTAHPDTRNMLRQWYEPTVLTLHARRDPTVPILHETAYADLVAAAGASDMLVQRIVDMFGHAAFDVATRVAAFQDLDAWVTTGVRPTP